MRRLFTVLTLVVGLTLALQATDPELAGNWIGAIDTNRGQMEIGLNIRVDNGKLSGALKTAHGDWEVTAITEKDGVWTVAFKGGGNEGKLIGRIKDNKFTGDWKSEMADGTFDLARAKKKS